MHNILAVNINDKEVQAFLGVSWSCWKTLMVAINNQEKDGVAQNQKLFTPREKKKPARDHLCHSHAQLCA